MLNWLRRRLNPPPFESLSSEQLMAICDRFWSPNRGDHAEYVRAVTALTNRGPEILDWARRLLVHPDYWARETGAWLLGELGNRNQLEDTTETVIAELGALTRRSAEEDAKETQAIDTAVNAIARIGRPSGISHLRAVLFSDNDFLRGDSQWVAAEAMGKLVGQSFMQLPDPVAAAREWLLANPDIAHNPT